MVKINPALSSILSPSVQAGQKKEAVFFEPGNLKTCTVEECNIEDCRQNVKDKQKEIIKLAANELIADINSGKVALPEGMDKAQVIKFLEESNRIQSPEGSKIPPKEQLKNILYDMAVKNAGFRFNEEQLEQKIENIKAKLQNVLAGKTFDGPNGKKVSGDEILKIINNPETFVFQGEDYGAGEAKNGKIVLNVNNKYTSSSDAELTKLIIHEALHAAYNNQGPDTWEEERCCEEQAIMIASEIINAEGENPETTFTDFNIYGTNVSEYSRNSEQLHKDVDNWLENGYSNRLKDSGGNISIIKNPAFPDNRIEIQSGDEIYINNQSAGKIGEYFLESSLLTNNGNSNIMQFIQSDGHFEGLVVFDDTVDNTGASQRIPDTEPQIIEIRRGNEIICKGKIYK